MRSSSRSLAVAPVTAAEPWQTVLADHQGLIGELHTDAAWARAAADYAASVRPHGVQLVTLTDATTPRSQPGSVLGPTGTGRRSSARAARVTAFAASVEAPDGARAEPAAELVTHLLTHPEAHALAGAELAVGHGWIGLRRHPRATGTVAYGGPAVPAWLDATLREMVGYRPLRDLPGGARMTARPDPAHRRCPRASVGPSSDRLVPVSRPPPTQGAGDASRMYRRFDLDTYRAETSDWNVEKIVNVAAATGRHSVDETIALDASADQAGGPDAIIGGLPPTDTAREAIALLDTQMAASRFPVSGPWARTSRPSPSPRCCVPSKSATWSSS